MGNIDQQIKTELTILINLINSKDDDVIIEAAINKDDTLNLIHAGNFKGFEIISKLSNALKAGGFLKKEDLDEVNIFQIHEGIEINSDNCDFSIKMHGNNIKTTFTPKGSPDQIITDLKKAVASAEKESPQDDKTWVKHVEKGKIKALLPPFTKSPSNWYH